MRSAGRKTDNGRLELNETHELIQYLSLSLFLVASLVFATKKIRRHKNQSYELLIKEKERLKDIVFFWAYPDGTQVPSHKRQRMFEEIRSISRQIREHPDHPGNDE
jgi:hypothetical protein